MIAGIGVDIVDVARVQALLDRYGERFLRRVYTEAETAYAMGGENRAERLAGRFAVKEAMMKALGTGKSQGILWRDVETLRDRSGTSRSARPSGRTRPTGRAAPAGAGR